MGGHQLRMHARQQQRHRQPPCPPATHLPQLHARGGQPVDEGKGLRPDLAHAVFAGQAGWVQDDARPPVLGRVGARVAVAAAEGGEGGGCLLVNVSEASNAAAGRITPCQAGTTMALSRAWLLRGWLAAAGMHAIPLPTLSQHRCRPTLLQRVAALVGQASRRADPCACFSPQAGGSPLRQVVAWLQPREGVRVRLDLADRRRRSILRRCHACQQAAAPQWAGGGERCGARCRRPGGPGRAASRHRRDGGHRHALWIAHRC